MKSSYLILAAILLASCARSKAVTTSQPNLPVRNTETLSLPFQKPVSTQGLTLTLQKTIDDRCPPNINCIRAGSAITYVQVQDKHQNSVTKVLYLGDALTSPEKRGFRTADTIQVALGSKNYQLTLTEVLPYPNTSEPDTITKTAKIAVTEL